ncbi:unnamed protein product, partial [Heterosigma akashiwo]
SLIKDGQLSKAARTLTQAHLAAMTDENVQKAQTKHPRRNTPCGGPDLSQEETKGEEIVGGQPLATAPKIDPVTLVAAVRTASRGSSPGISGWRYEHLEALLEPDGGDEAPLIQPFIQALVDSDIPEGKWELLRIGSGFLLNKEDGDVRPITTADTLRRIATRVLVFQYKERWRDHLGPIQFAVGTPNGCDKLAHCVRAFLDQVEGEDTPYCALLLLDAENAFNCCDRQKFMDALHKGFPELHSFFVLQFYFGESNILYRRKDGLPVYVISSQGTQQGNPAGPFFFCLGLKAVLAKLQRELHEPCAILGLMDDVTVLLPSDQAEEAWNKTKACFQEYGLTLRADKSKLLPLDARGLSGHDHADKPSGEVEIARAGAKLVSLLYDSELYIETYLRQRLAKTQELLTEIAKMGSVQDQLLLLRACAHPRVAYWNRLL